MSDALMRGRALAVPRSVLGRAPGLIALLTAVAAAGSSGCRPGAETTAPVRQAGANQPGPGVVIAWTSCEAANDLQELAYDYTARTHVPVTVEQTAPDAFADRIETALSAHSRAYDLIAGEPAWLGRFAASHDYVELTSWARAHVRLSDIPRGILNGLCATTLARGHRGLFAVPCEPDGTAFAYRADLFANPAEQAAFRRRYHYALSAPATWARLRDIAEFFTRPKSRLYGVALPFRGPDLVLGFLPVLLSFGGELPGTAAASSDADATAALRLYTRDLRAFTPGSTDADFSRVAGQFETGNVAMAELRFTDIASLSRAAAFSAGPAGEVGCFAVPAGPHGQYAGLCGYGLCLSAYAPHRAAALRFLEWFERLDTQAQWARLGGLPADRAATATAQFFTYHVSNAVYAQSMDRFCGFDTSARAASLLRRCERDWQPATTGRARM